MNCLFLILIAIEHTCYQRQKILFLVKLRLKEGFCLERAIKLHSMYASFTLCDAIYLPMPTHYRSLPMECCPLDGHFHNTLLTSSPRQASTTTSWLLSGLTMTSPEELVRCPIKCMRTAKWNLSPGSALTSASNSKQTSEQHGCWLPSGEMSLSISERKTL